MILSTARQSEHKLLVSDTLYLILSFVENERVPLFRQVCKSFKEVTELEVEREEGILYAYGKIKKYRCNPPFNLCLSDYIVSTYLFEWALENGYVFKPTLEELIEEKKRFPFNYSTNNWNTTLWKYASKELLFKYVIQTGRTVLSKEEVFPHFIERWHSDEDIPDYIKLKDMGYSPRNPASLTNAIKFGASYSVIRWLVSGECSLRKEHWLDLGNCELSVLKEILKHDDGQRYPFSKQELLVSWLKSSVQRNNLEIFKYFYEKYSHFYLQELNRERYLTEICAYAGEDILNFLTEEKIITPKLLNNQYADVIYSHCNLRCIKWLIEKGISAAEHQVILPLGPFDVPQHFTEHEWVNLSRWFLDKQLLTNAQKKYMFYSSIEEGSLPLFDLIFPQISDLLTSGDVLIVDWSKFKSLDRFIEIFKTLTTTSGEMKPFRSVYFHKTLAEAGLFDCLQFLHENDCPMDKGNLKQMCKFSNKLTKERFNEWIDTI